MCSTRIYMQLRRWPMSIMMMREASESGAGVSAMADEALSPHYGGRACF